MIGCRKFPYVNFKLVSSERKFEKSHLLSCEKSYTGVVKKTPKINYETYNVPERSDQPICG